MIPVINLMSWPSKCLKGAAGELIVTLEKIVGKLLMSSKNNLPLAEEFPSVSKPGKIVFRLLQHLWFQVSIFFSVDYLCNCWKILPGSILNYGIKTIKLSQTNVLKWNHLFANIKFYSLHSSFSAVCGSLSVNILPCLM